MPEGISETIPTPTGIPQGSPLSPILYLIYNSDLVQAEGMRVTASGWVDDVTFMAEGRTEEESIEKLHEACRHADQWASKHASVSDPKKYALVHFINPNPPKNSPAIEPLFTPLVLPTATVPASQTAERYLAFWLDPGLTFVHHREKMLAKAGVSLQALRGLAGSTWGASLSAMRQIY